ncbi:hypothetical protein LCGC14_1498120 [marine sediment metagenome]|uniref:Uncharacterized protein n=1 Tax=marine sediment metagenome TaxID=412755 RepID=A0A0F9M691_9ZZZZ
MNDKIAKTLSLLKRKSVSFKVDGFEKAFNFWPVSIGQLYEMQTVFNPLLEAIRTVMVRTADVSKVNQTEQMMDEAGGVTGVTIVNQVGEINPILAKQRSEETKVALQQIMSELFSDENKVALAGLLADSLRDVFPRDCDSEDKIAFFEQMDIVAMIGFVQGFVRANVKVIGPFADRIKAKIEKAVNKALSEASEQPFEVSPESEETEARQEELSLDPTID